MNGADVKARFPSRPMRLRAVHDNIFDESVAPLRVLPDPDFKIAFNAPFFYGISIAIVVKAFLPHLWDNNIAAYVLPHRGFGLHRFRMPRVPIRIEGGEYLLSRSFGIPAPHEIAEYYRDYGLNAVIRFSYPDQFRLISDVVENAIGMTNVEQDRINDGETAAANTCKQVWGTSRFAVDIMRGCGVTVPLHVIPHGIDIDMFDRSKLDEARISEMRSLLGLEGKFVALFVGRASDWRKAVPEMIEAFATFARNHPDAVLLMHSDKVQANLERIKALGMESRIRYTGDYQIPWLSFSYHDMPYLYAMADALLLPSHSEGVGMPLIEAGAMGIPRIGMAFSGCDELVNHGVDGFKLTPRLTGAWGQPSDDPNSGKWADYEPVELIGFLEALHNDPSRRSEMGIKAREFIAANYTWDLACAKVKEALARL